MTHPIHEFTFILERDPSDEELDALFDLGAEDATAETRRGAALLHFDREAESLAAALVSALRETRETGLIVTAVKSEDYVSLRDIATRVDRSYEGVRLLATGQRGPGGFPPAYQRGEWALYSWTQVLDWFNRNMREITETSIYDREIAAADLLVRARRLLDDDDNGGTVAELFNVA